MTGCPNGCARPYMAELGFVGDGPNSYQVSLSAGTFIRNQHIFTWIFSGLIKIRLFLKWCKFCCVIIVMAWWNT